LIVFYIYTLHLHGLTFLYVLYSSMPSCCVQVVCTYVQVYVQSDRRTVPVHELKSLVHELALVYDIKTLSRTGQKYLEIFLLVSEFKLVLRST
jgi:hypothetical protein